MNKIMFFVVLLATGSVYAAETKNEWQNTTISEETIAKIQQAKLEYKQCVGAEMQKSVYQNQDSRKSTETIVKQCEPVLAKMRVVYTDQKVPGVVADRHLKQMRYQMMRDVLQNMMYLDAARKAGQPQ